MKEFQRVKSYQLMYKEALVNYHKETKKEKPTTFTGKVVTHWNRLPRLKSQLHRALQKLL